MSYRGRLAPSPTGLLHLGHAQTFWIAYERSAGGILVMRNEDIDRSRTRPEFVDAFLDDLSWLGIRWQEGPYHQSERLPIYEQQLEQNKAAQQELARVRPASLGAPVPPPPPAEFAAPAPTWLTEDDSDDFKGGLSLPGL